MFSSTVLTLATLLTLAPSTLSLAHDKIYNHPKRATTWNLATTYSGTNFFNGWSFFTSSDPTHGQVNFLSASAAASAKLAYVNSAGQAIMKVDNTTTLASGANRNSVRISSNEAVNVNSLVIMDAAHMPYGCSVWPAFWMVGPNWPSGGEIDIVEGVHNNAQNQMTLHTEPGCTHASGATETGTALESNCDASVNSNSGCGVLDPSTSSYGAGFAANGGGVFATQWLDGAGISVWFFPRNSIPADITSGNPNPASWGESSAYWPASTCNPDTYFSDMQIVFDITLCGDWAGNAWPANGCTASSCSSVVTSPSTYNNAYFEVNYVKVYTLASNTGGGSGPTNYAGATCNWQGLNPGSGPNANDCATLFSNVAAQSGSFIVDADTVYGQSYGTCALQFCNWGSADISYDFADFATVGKLIDNEFINAGDSLAQCVFVEGGGSQYVQVQNSAGLPNGGSYSLSGRTYC